MTFETFAYWLQGFVELTGGTPPTEEQWKSIVEHLGLVFNKVTSPVKQPAKQILVEGDAPEKDLPKEDPPKEAKDWLKEFEDIFRKAAERADRAPYEPWTQQPGWPGISPNVPVWPTIAPTTIPGTSSPSFPGDYYCDPLGYPRVFC